MSIKTFWAILIKVLGIFLLFSSLGVIQQVFSVLLFLVSGNPGQNLLGVIVFSILTIGFYLFVLWLLLFNTFWLIDKLNLDKGFAEERIE